MAKQSNKGTGSKTGDSKQSSNNSAGGKARNSKSGPSGFKGAKTGGRPKKD